MNQFLKTGLFIAIFYCFSVKTVAAQNLKFEELTACLSDKNYPESLFEMVEAKGFYRVDKQYLEYCDRVVYAFQKANKPVMFVNPTLCPKPQRSEIYPVKVKTEVELQFQKSGRLQFENLRTVIKKQCKPLPLENGMAEGQKSKNTRRAYRHEASGITFLILDAAPVSYIYLLK